MIILGLPCKSFTKLEAKTFYIYDEVQVNETNNNSLTEGLDTLLSRLFNTKWYFTDAKGTRYEIITYELARDGKSVRAEVNINGELIGYTTIASWSWTSEFKGYEFKSIEHTKIFFPKYSNSFDYELFSSLLRWDYEKGFLYKNGDAYDSESPIQRLSITKHKPQGSTRIKNAKDWINFVSANPYDIKKLGNEITTMSPSQIVNISQEMVNIVSNLKASNAQTTNTQVKIKCYAYVLLPLLVTGYQAAYDKNGYGFSLSKAEFEKFKKIIDASQAVRSYATNASESYSKNKTASESFEEWMDSLKK